MIWDETTHRSIRLHPPIRTSRTEEQGRIHQDPKSWSHQLPSISNESVVGSPTYWTWASHRTWQNSCLPMPPCHRCQFKHHNRTSSYLLVNPRPRDSSPRETSCPGPNSRRRLLHLVPTDDRPSTPHLRLEASIPPAGVGNQPTAVEGGEKP
jgi:hypothetical protein